MQSSIFTQLRRFFIFRNTDETYSQVAIEAAHRCLENVVKRLNRNGNSWSEAQLHGYLRAVAVPSIDSALVEISPQSHQTAKIHAKVKGLALDTLEQLVIEKLKKQRFVHITGAAAA
jgi:hypothetical protein